MASPYQVRASVNAWLASHIVLATGKTPADRIVYQGIQGQQPTEWHLSWDAERDGATDQAFARVFQIVRSRADGDEMAFERESDTLLNALGLASVGRGPAVPIYDYPNAKAVQIGSAIVRRQGGKGWSYLPDPGNRPEVIRAVITLSVDYAP